MKRWLVGWLPVDCGPGTADSIGRGIHAVKDSPPRGHVRKRPCGVGRDGLASVRMIRFKLFGIPVEVQPFFWVTTCLLGGGITAHTREAILSVVIFMIAALISILVHELGHALTGLRYGGGFARITLTAFGGLAYHDGAMLSPNHRFRMVAAGPGAGIALFALTAGLLCLAFPPVDVMSLVSYLLFGFNHGFTSGALPGFITANPVIFDFIGQMLWINFWWSLINLLPVLPLDGGKIAELFVHPRRRVYQIGIACAGAVALYGYFKLHETYMALLFAFLAWENYQKLRSESWR